jgi:aspartyl-tRNA(Asn)/glutamyl-tRNA(Gln) amidotransferase subunit B
VLSEGGKINQETRLWNLDRGETVVMRSKEEAHDYRYFPDPDLLPLKLEKDWIEGLRKSLSELPADRQKRIIIEYGVSEYLASVLTTEKATVERFENVASVYAQKVDLQKAEVGSEVANLITTDLRGVQNKAKSFSRSVSDENLVDLLVRKHKGEISKPTANTVLEEMVTTGNTAAEIIEAKGLKQVSDEGTIERIIDEVLVKNPTQVGQFKEGKQQVLGFLVGQVMKASGGKANPGKVNELLKRKLQ